MSKIKKVVPLACPNCNSKDNIEIYDCGYSSFNCGGGKCSCKFHVYSCCLSCHVSNEHLILIWNEGIKKYKRYKRMKLNTDELKKLGIINLQIRI